MITTVDGVKCKRGEKVWEIGWEKDHHRPTMSVVHGGKNDVANPDRCWKSYDLCLNECALLNEGRKSIFDPPAIPALVIPYLEDNEKKTNP